MEIIGIETHSEPQCYRLGKGCQNSSSTTSLFYVWRLGGPRAVPSLVSRQAARYLAAIIFIWSCRTRTRNQVAWPSVALSSTSHSHSISKWVIITAHLKKEALHAVFSIVDSNVFWNKCKNAAFQKRASQTASAFPEGFLPQTSPVLILESLPSFGVMLMWWAHIFITLLVRLPEMASIYSSPTPGSLHESNQQSARNQRHENNDHSPSWLIWALVIFHRSNTTNSLSLCQTPHTQTSVPMSSS